MTREEFIKIYRAAMPDGDKLDEKMIVPCECVQEHCTGWRIVKPEPDNKKDDHGG